MQRRSLVLSLRVIGETLAISAPTVVEATLGRLTKEACDRRLAGWSKKVVRDAKIDLEVRGLEHFDPERTCVLMSNHQSHYDVPVLFAVFGGNVRMVAKIELFSVPIFGKALAESGFIPIDRGDRANAIANLERAKRALEKGVHVWIAPEGTRSRTGELGAFKKGGFVLALDAGLPVLPISIRGTRHVLPATGVRSAPGARVRVTVHRALEPRSYGGDDRRLAVERLMADVRAAIEGAL